VKARLFRCFAQGLIYSAFLLLSLLVGRLLAQEFRVTGIHPVQDSVELGFQSSTSAYYQVWASDSLTGEWTLIRGMTLGAEQTQSWLDSGIIDQVNGLFYRVRRVPLDQPLDEDGDGIDDAYELRHAQLDPLNSADGQEDLDNDGYLNVYEYARGSDIADADSVPTATIYVDASASPGGDGSSNAPLDTIQGALNTATNYDVIELAAGTYTGVGNRDLDYKGKAVMLVSTGLPGTCVIDCENAGRGFHFHNNEDARSILRGLTIQNGSATEGGGIYCESSGPLIQNCVIVSNNASSSGGGVCSSLGGPLIRNCAILWNTSSSNGGGVCCYGGDPQVDNCTISGNSADNGGGVWCQDGGIIRNSIIYLNQAASNANNFMSGAVTYSHSCSAPLLAGEGNVTDDPRFLDVSAGDYRLIYNSPCVNAGSNMLWMAAAGDLDGRDRIVGDAVDMGAYEFRKPPLVICEPEPGSGPTDEDDPPGPYGSHTTDAGYQLTYDYWYEVTPSAGEIINCFRVFTGVQYDGASGSFQNRYYPTGWRMDLQTLGNLTVICWTNITGSPLTNGCTTTFGFDHRNDAGWYAWKTDTDSSDHHASGTNGYGYLVHAPTAVRTGPDVTYVSASGLHVFPYTNWATAATNIQAAVDAGGDGTVVLVTNGTYVLSTQITIRDGMTVRSVNGGTSTVVDGNHATRCFYLSHSNAVLDGFVITRGYASCGGGVFCSRGGTICNCTITDNNASYSGGGIYVYQGGLRVENCLIEGNSALSYGGGLYCDSSTPRIQNCTIADNNAVAGGAIYNGWATTSMVHNSILWGNGSNQIYISGGAVAVSYSCVEGGYAGLGNTGSAPELIPGNYHLKSGSACIDAASSSNAPVNDMDGEARWDDPAHSNVVSIVDMGVDEFTDTDGNGMADAWELEHFGDLISHDGTGDGDSDGLNDLAEYENGTNPTRADTDGDGLNDGVFPIITQFASIGFA